MPPTLGAGHDKVRGRFYFKIEQQFDFGSNRRPSTSLTNCNSAGKKTNGRKSETDARQQLLSRLPLGLWDKR